MSIHAVESDAPPVVELLAEEFYLAVMQATRDHWLLWKHLPHAERSGYYDLAYEVADKVEAARNA